MLFFEIKITKSGCSRIEGCNLAVSRALGDVAFRKFGCINTPHVSTTKIEENMNFLILATDGVVDEFDNKGVILYILFFFNVDV